MASTVRLRGLARHGYPYERFGRVYLNIPERLPYEDRDDTRIYPADAGEYLVAIAAAQYPGFTDVWLLAQIIAEFQPNPIINLGAPFTRPTYLELPSRQYIQEVALGPSLHEAPVL